ncbi:MAG: amylo-alpha-1,6-glucosidase [Gammaproteobacteria bacterium]
MTGGLPQAVRFGREVCGSLPLADCREWWITNGISGYAAGTVSGTLTRRYHGLLFAPLSPQSDRTLVFAKADATLIGHGQAAWPLYTNRWVGGIVQPEGHVHIESFHLDGRMPVWQYAIGNIRLEARVWMEHGANTTYIAYRLDPEYRGIGEGLELEVNLLANARNHHHTTQPGDFRPVIETEGNRLKVLHPNRFALSITASQGSISPDDTWVERFYLSVERARGLPDQDNHLSVGHAALRLEPGQWVGIVASLDADVPDSLDAALKRFQDRDSGVLAQARQQNPEFADAPVWLDQLLLAADTFLVTDPQSAHNSGESVVAGYPWFGEWGRDTLIALPGLTLACGKANSARDILEHYASFLDGGMIPNVLPGNGQQAAYNTVDAALWYVEAWRAYVEFTRDSQSLQWVFPTLADIIAWYSKGTRYGIIVDPIDGLLKAGEPGTQITWMDAKIDDWVVTPRIGKPVEVNALWFNALSTMAAFAKHLGLTPEARQYGTLAAQAQKGFQRFIKGDGCGLFDVIDGPSGDDPSIRPNQILALSLYYSALDAPAQEQVLKVCGDALLCSYGLRSLDPAHPEFRPHYGGSVRERDSSYHQGPVWAWLLGHYALADYRVRGNARVAQSWLEPIRDHLCDAGLGTVSEIFDGAPPHHPRGCPTQAWSVACVLEAWWRLERLQPSRQAEAPTNAPRLRNYIEL